MTGTTLLVRGCAGPSTPTALPQRAPGSERRAALASRTTVYAQPISLRQVSKREHSPASTTPVGMLACLSENTAVSLTQGVQ